MKHLMPLIIFFVTAILVAAGTFGPNPARCHYRYHIRFSIAGTIFGGEDS